MDKQAELQGLLVFQFLIQIVLQITLILTYFLVNRTSVRVHEIYKFEDLSITFENRSLPLRNKV